MKNEICNEERAMLEEICGKEAVEALINKNKIEELVSYNFRIQLILVSI